MVSIQIRFNDDEDSRQVTTRKLPDLPTELTGQAEWKVHRKSRRNSYILRIQEEDSDGGQPVSYELPVKYINHCWYGLNWNEALRQYFTNPKERLPDGYGGLRRGQPPQDEPGPSNIPPPIPPLGEPLQAGTTFSQGIHSVLHGITSNPALLSTPQITVSTPVVTPGPVPRPTIMSTSASAPPVTAQATITVTTFPPFPLFIVPITDCLSFRQPCHLSFHCRTSLHHHLPTWLFFILISDSDSLCLPSYLRHLVRYFDLLWQAFPRPFLYLTLASTMTKP